MEQLSIDSVKLRSILVKDMLSTNDESLEMNLIKTRLREVEEKKLSLLFDATEKANLIMGRQAVKNEELIRSFRESYNRI